MTGTKVTASLIYTVGNVLVSGRYCILCIEDNNWMLMAFFWSEEEARPWKCFSVVTTNSG